MKRISDLVFSLVMMIILSPFLILISLLILLDFRGGPFFVQKRVGKGNCDFLMIKFRTMKPGSEKSGQLTVGSRDSRITGIGYFLRKFKLDELPQLFNVFTGQMSVVGPRPEVRKYVELYSEAQKKVLSVRPGLTDYASVEYYNENDLLAKSENPERTYIEVVMPAKLKLNEKYISEMGFRTDMKIIFRTIGRIFK